MSGRRPSEREKPWKRKAGIFPACGSHAFTTSPQHFAPWSTTGRPNSAASSSCAANMLRMRSGMVFDFMRSRPISPTPTDVSDSRRRRSADSAAATALGERTSRPFRPPHSRHSHGWTPWKKMFSEPAGASTSGGRHTNERAPPRATWQCASVMKQRTSSTARQATGNTGASDPRRTSSRPPPSPLPRRSS